MKRRILIGLMGALLTLAFASSAQAQSRRGGGWYPGMYSNYWNPNSYGYGSGYYGSGYYGNGYYGNNWGRGYSGYYGNYYSPGYYSYNSPGYSGYYYSTPYSNPSTSAYYDANVTTSGAVVPGTVIYRDGRTSVGTSGYWSSPSYNYGGYYGGRRWRR